ncbi:hypothetical protein EVAR_44748_1 [Eumeta japonica]|uniref:Uncharacterized protein n=1 Tax=Eumeta variegata TaxID=151549 RepID=A0A4C1XGG4_EUMVA|nr:hypothetical protein EVAR_44748_1 [Eumeta japonica]
MIPLRKRNYPRARPAFLVPESAGDERSRSLHAVRGGAARSALAGCQWPEYSRGTHTSAVVAAPPPLWPPRRSPAICARADREMNKNNVGQASLHAGYVRTIRPTTYLRGPHVNSGDKK